MKLNINSAKKGNTSFKFSPISLTTLDFGRLQPLRVISCIAGDQFNVAGKGLLRCTPQVFPPFGRMNVKNASFFVPDSQICSWSTAFHANQKTWRGQPSTFLPNFDSFFLNIAFTPFDYYDSEDEVPASFNMALSTIVADSPAHAPARNTYDFTVPCKQVSITPNDTNLCYLRLTPLGWKIYSIFKSLGYDFISFAIKPNARGTAYSRLYDELYYISAMPFLAYAKIWNDYFCNSYQSDNNIVSSYLQKIYLNQEIPASSITHAPLYDNTQGTIMPELINKMIIELQLPYENSMYTNAWNRVNDPTGTHNNDINQISQSSLISPYTNGSSQFGERTSLSVDLDRNIHTSTRGEFSELGHKTLEAFDRFVRRRNLVGSKAVQQIYAMFGIMPDEWGHDYVAKLSEGSNRVNFSAITSTSDTAAAGGSPLGAFAGQGMSGYDINFTYKADTFGQIISLAWLNIDPIFMHGMSPDVLRVMPLDYYSADWDGKAYRPIPFSEITGGKSIERAGRLSKTIFGYTNMYDDYRNMNDVVAGNFLDDTTRHFAFMRDLTETRNIAASFGLEANPQSEDVQYWHIDGQSDLTNPFITDASLNDRFWFCVDWNISAVRPILGHEDSFDLDGAGSVSINKNGNGMA